MAKTTYTPKEVAQIARAYTNVRIAQDQLDNLDQVQPQNAEKIETQAQKVLDRYKSLIPESVLVELFKTASLKEKKSLVNFL